MPAPGLSLRTERPTHRAAFACRCHQVRPAAQDRPGVTGVDDLLDLEDLCRSKRAAIAVQSLADLVDFFLYRANGRQVESYS